MRICLWSQSAGRQLTIWSSRADDWISPLCCIYGNPICPNPTIYDLFALQVLQSAQGSVKQTQNPFIGWKSHRRGGESQPSQKPYYLLSATQAEPATMRWLFMCLTMIIIPKNGEISQSVNRKGNNSRPKLRKPSHDNGILEISACSQRTCRLKLSAMYRNKTSIQYLD